MAAGAPAGLAQRSGNQQYGMQRAGTPRQTMPGTAVSGSGRIQGRVFDAAGGDVLGKAEVRLSGGPAAGASQPGSPAAPGMVARTGADGGFLFENLPAGEYALTVTRRAFAACGAEVKGLPGRQQGCATRFTLREGQQMENVQVRLLRAGVITGEVRDEDGEPMAGVVVEAEQYRYLRGSKVLTASGRATTDDRGQYRIFDLSPGRYFVKAQGRGLVARLAGALMGGAGPGSMGAFGRGGFRGMGEETISYPPTYFPSAEVPEESIPLQLTPGTEMGGIDFRLLPSATYRIQGAVAGVSGEQLTGVTVTARRVGSTLPLGGPTGFASVDGRSGAFTLRGLTPGRYELIARSMGMRRGGQSAGVAGVVTVGLGTGNLDGVSIPLRPDTELQGRVLVPRGKEDAQLERMRVSLESFLQGPQRMARVDADGRFALTVSAADRLEFLVEGVPAGLYLKAMKVGGVDLLAEGTQPPSDVAGEFVVELGADGGAVAGVTRDGAGKAAGGARVVLLPERTGMARSLLRRTTVSGEDGSYQFADVPPGRYRLYVFEELESGPALDADFLSNFGQRWKAVEVRPGGQVSPESPWVAATETAMLLGEMAQ